MSYKIINNDDDKEKSSEENNKSNSNSFFILEPEWSLEEIVLSQKVRDTLDDVVSFCLNKDKIVEDWNLKRFLKGSGGSIGINFFGNPGTGKSIAAEGVAKAIGKQIIRADYSEITDSLMGGTEKKLSELFQNAEKNNAVIFFDEADGLLSKRMSGTRSAESTNQVKSHLLTLLDKSNVVIIFATNFFENYDKAFFRRILFHINFEMPTKEQRVALWEFHIDTKVPKSISYDTFAELTEGMSGGDIKNIALKLCIKLSSAKVSTIDENTLKNEVEKYKKALEASEMGEPKPIPKPDFIDKQESTKNNI